MATLPTIPITTFNNNYISKTFVVARSPSKAIFSEFRARDTLCGSVHHDWSSAVFHLCEREGQDPVILVCHGLADEAKNMAGFVAALLKHNKLLLTHRIIAPDAVGHGTDLSCALNNPDMFQQPTPAALLQSTVELLDALHIADCCAFGHSLGGSLAHCLNTNNPTQSMKLCSCRQRWKHVSTAPLSMTLCHTKRITFAAKHATTSRCSCETCQFGTPRDETPFQNSFWKPCCANDCAQRLPTIFVT